MGRLAGKVVLVTGGSRGIGRAVAREAGREGARVALSFREKEEDAEAVVREIASGAVPGSGGEAAAFRADLARPEAASELVDAVLQRFGAIDALVNNAGIVRDGLVAAMEDGDWEEVLRVNAGGVFRMCRAVAMPMMRAKRGRIVNLSSVAATKPGRGQANYAASKGAIEALTRALAIELAPKGIAVNAVAPGVIETEMTAFVRGAAPEEVLAHIPFKRYGSADEVARAVLFLASDEASYITGAVLPVDGGFR